MGRGEGGGFRMGSPCIPEIFLILKIKKKWKKKKRHFNAFCLIQVAVFFNVVSQFICVNMV